MRRLDRFKLLQLFGDGKDISYFSAVYLGVHYFKVSQTKFEKLLRQSLEDGLIKLVETPEIIKLKKSEDYIIIKEMYNYQLTPRGDECLRCEQISRAGDVSYYKYFDRSVNGKHGAQKYSPMPTDKRPNE